MKVETFDRGGSVTLVRLAGKLDVVGAEAASMPLAAAAGACRLLIVDLADCGFVASIGIRHLISGAKAMAARGGKLVLMSPTRPVEDVLATMGVTAMLPIVRSEGEAREAYGA